MPPTEFTCQVCGNGFSLSPAVLTKYPNWTPKSCMNCREKPAPGAKAKPGGGRGRSVTRAGNLTTTEILLRFSSGPTDGVFTDGSCQGNPGPGGWGAVHVRDGKVLEQRWGSDPATTNNRMELTAMIEGLAMTAPDEAIEVYSDSMLVVNTLTKWASSWAARGWKRKEGEVANLDLVQRAYELMQERPKARVQWLRAHDGSRWNEYADSLSQAYLREEV